MTLQQLHDLEIPGGISWLYDSAWSVWIGVAPKRAEAVVKSEDEALTWLAKMAAEIYGVKVEERK